MASLRLGSLPRRGGSGSHRDGTFPRAGYRDRVPPAAALPAGKPTASSWKPPSLRIPGPRHGVAFHRGERGFPRRGEADRVVLEAAITADTETSSRCRLPPSRWEPPSPRGSGPRNVGGSCRCGYRDTVPLSAPLPTPEASLAAGKRTPSRWILPSQLIPEPRLVGAFRAGEGSFPRPAAPNPELRQDPTVGIAPPSPAQRPLPTPPALKGRQQAAEVADRSVVCYNLGVRRKLAFLGWRICQKLNPVFVR
jgi:hypothetical protein